MTVGNEHAENLLASLLWLMINGCNAVLPQVKGPLGPGEELGAEKGTFYFSLRF